ncbi:MAG: Gfo/Idh/MocA family oxidoreductase [Anaerolineae bacterium]|nr:Gfo/Idh/MocA family oxidoreductase [Anaerolineae bacterium]
MIGVGIVGAGQIVEAAHLPAYRQLGLPVLALFDSNAQRAERLCSLWAVQQVYSLEELFASPEISIMDIAVPPTAQVDICRQALQAGKHVLAQKPLARTLETATMLVELARGENRLLGVNQQMRWSPVIQTIRAAVSDGRLGALRSLNIDLDLAMPVGFSPANHWLAAEPRFTVLFNTIHLLDAARFLLGEPLRLSATIGNYDPHLQAMGETDASVVLTYSDGETVTLTDRRNAFGDHRATFRATGIRGAIRGRFGLWTNYPVGVDDILEYAAVGGQWECLSVRGRWIPDAFTGPIGQLASAIESGTALTVSGEDHLLTLRLVEAVYESAAVGHPIEL